MTKEYRLSDSNVVEGGYKNATAKDLEEYRDTVGLGQNDVHWTKKYRIVAAGEIVRRASVHVNNILDHYAVLHDFGSGEKIWYWTSGYLQNNRKFLFVKE